MSSADRYGKRLATAVYQAVTVDSSTETHEVTYRNLANIVNSLARWLDQCTPVTEEHSQTIGYLAASDVRHLAIVCAAVKSGTKVLLLSSRNTAAVHSHLLRAVNSSLLVYDEPFHDIAQTIAREGHIRTRALHRPCSNVSTTGASAKITPTMAPGRPPQTMPLRYELLPEPKVSHHSSHNQILHTTGSTGMPKPVTIPQSAIAAIDAQHLVSCVTGRQAQLEVVAEAATVFLGFPLCHVAGLGLGWFLLLAGRALLLPGPGKPVSRHMVRAILQLRPFDAALLPPSVVDDIAEDAQLFDELARCKYLMFGGGCIKPQTGKILAERRKKTIQAYQEEINALYEGSPAAVTGTEMCFDFSSKEAFASSLARFVANLTDTNHLNHEDDFFEAGMMSQQVEVLVTSLRRAIQSQPDCKLDNSLLNEDAVYSAASADKLASLLFDEVDGSQRTHSQGRIEILSAMLDNSPLPVARRLEETTSYYHFVNPHPAKWGPIAPSVIAELQRECRMTSLSDWVRRLEDHAARAANSGNQASSGVKLIGFYQSLQGPPLELETGHTQEVIHRLGSIPPVNEEWMRVWLEQWASH
ncbi:acetyl-CoA synthetase-like protein [Aspergillus japonicus CBS 114.51]|uniref:Acetyl-CoA synthetase-like protein n=1 Tax=Aspergillus japonicus CBS 114.51 TaxID=1448312 RepID=A0A8T8WLA0_ASPJA|nr:acetyl-CoA synthetase-like protein [Aspergillus japonicus CBS 114.51]RAH76635.1 acetyl-CoA synthetase-like protein [Aspergillus japonicus CBS 114.51]